jgi:hypothetical protein
VLLALIGAFSVERSKSDPHLKFVPFELDFLEIEVPISNIVLARTVLGILALLSMTAALLADYSELYPESLKMNVFFDQQGIYKTLRSFSKSECLELGIVEDYEPHQKIYYRMIDEELERVLGVRLAFVDHREDIYSEGETTFIVEKVSGVQRYHLEESEGKLRHVLERRREAPLHFMTFFEKKSSSRDYFEGDLWKLLTGRGCIIAPLFNQILAENMKTSGRIFDHAVVGVTRVRLYPFPCYSTTLYLSVVENVGLVPIGYAVYR